ncbi:MAG TPA: hypothetical protein VK806_13305 [Bacteroidia bacterium]|jgi:hypothetical protein|nr:hypothetical protein [Bacteroidia bacterium]
MTEKKPHKSKWKEWGAPSVLVAIAALVYAMAHDKCSESPKPQPTTVVNTHQFDNWVETKNTYKDIQKIIAGINANNDDTNIVALKKCVHQLDSCLMYVTDNDRLQMPVRFLILFLNQKIQHNEDVQNPNTVKSECAALNDSINKAIKEGNDKYGK